MPSSRPNDIVFAKFDYLAYAAPIATLNTEFYFHLEVQQFLNIHPQTL